MDSSRRSESLPSPHLFLSLVLISFSLENGHSTDAVVTGNVVYFEEFCQLWEDCVHIIFFKAYKHSLGTAERESIGRVQ